MQKIENLIFLKILTWQKVLVCGFGISIFGVTSRNKQNFGLIFFFFLCVTVLGRVVGVALLKASLINQ